MRNGVVAALLIVAACSSESDALEGDWKYAPAELDKMAPPMRASLESAVLTFRDGRVSAPDGSSYGYEVVATDGKTLTLEATDGRDKGRRIVVELESDTLTMTAKGMTIEYVRAK